MLSKDRAIYYYKSLYFNHFESLGTCEQRTLVLRARFDRILEEALVYNCTSRDFYIEKLQKIFQTHPDKFSSQIQKECQALRKYLGGIQHSRYEADEQEYHISLKRLCTIIYLLSGQNIPNELEQVWIDNVCNNTDAQKEAAPNKKNIENHNLEDDEVPAIICIDCSFLNTNDNLRDCFNELLMNLINEISSDGLTINLQLILLEKNRVKYVQPFLGKTNSINFDTLNSEIVDSMIENSLLFFKKRISLLEQNNIKKYSCWLITMFTERTTRLLSENSEIKGLTQSNKLIVLPIGLEKGMNPAAFNPICSNRETMILANKYDEFFNWLLECFKNVCKTN